MVNLSPKTVAYTTPAVLKPGTQAANYLKSLINASAPASWSKFSGDNIRCSQHGPTLSFSESIQTWTGVHSLGKV